MTIIHITSLSELNKTLSASSTKVSVIDFHATWCGPCHAIAPTFEALSKQYKNVNFFKCDVDVAKDVAAHYTVSAMPTFIFLKGSTKIDQVRGANRTALESALAKHATSSSSAFSGKGHTLGGGSAPVDLKHEARSVANQASSVVTGLTPPTKVFVGLIAAYAFFWYLS
ncbi:hypothetical protein EYR40_003697 [Pleurotus pulmonarius]|nr:hypothetical protein EYR40_003697 [Pleurotus pulmonarius]KAF4606410.1 hypothetical protein EYR38_000464 [Pleurotus pulmonarius]